MLWPEKIAVKNEEEYKEFLTNYDGEEELCKQSLIEFIAANYYQNHHKGNHLSIRPLIVSIVYKCMTCIPTSSRYHVDIATIEKIEWMINTEKHSVLEVLNCLDIRHLKIYGI